MRKVVLVLVAALSALLAVPALAADGTLSASAPSYKWAGGPLNGAGRSEVPTGFGTVRCSPAYECDNEHIEIKDTGTLTVDIKAGAGSNDLDVRLYKSDEAGTAPGVQQPGGTPPPTVAEDIRTEKDAKITVKNIKPGFYVVQVAAFSAEAGSYDGTATLAVSAPAAAPAPGAPAPAPTTTPQPTQTSPTPADNKADEAKRKKALAACNKKAAKKFKGSKNAKKRKAAQKKCAKKFAKKKA